jgi:hypothetical protein
MLAASNTCQSTAVSSAPLPGDALLLLSARIRGRCPTAAALSELRRMGRSLVLHRCVLALLAIGSEINQLRIAAAAAQGQKCKLISGVADNDELERR